ncbi:MAG: SDR family oxidoreductase [Ottowia sp.]|nr:SDR family oxidoreductase [Ottowia sp.]
MIEDFRDKTAVITGAASGFGLACARIAAARGMSLVLVDVQEDALERARAELAGAGVAVMARVVDVASGGQMEVLATAVQQRFGAPHLVFNNAGVGSGGLVWENSVAEWDWVLGVNLWGVIHGVRLFVPVMLQAAQADPAWRGHVVNTASMAGLVAAPNMGIYNTAKAAVVNLTETLYHDLKLVTDQVGASLLCPYFVPTNIMDSARNRPQAVAVQKPTRAQQISQAMLEQAVSHGKVSAQEVAQKVFAAVEQDRFYVFSHESPRALGNISSRMQAMVELKNPIDPFAQAPEVGARLRKQLREG